MTKRTLTTALLTSAVALGLGLSLTACSGGDDATQPAGETPAAGTTPAAGETPAPGDTTSTDGLTVLATYDKGLDFLKSKQEDGVWKVQGHASPGATALALASFLERPGGVRPTDKEMVDKSLAYLSSLLGDDGGVDKAHRPNYETSAVIGALVASGDSAYDAKVQAAAAYIKKFQFLDDDMNFGGIGYGSDNTRSDLSNTQFALGSLRAAGIAPEDPVFQNALKFVTRTQNRKENAALGGAEKMVDDKGKTVVLGNDGGANYRPFDSQAGFEELPDGTLVGRSYGSMTYALLRCYLLCGLDATDGRVQAAVEWIGDNWTLDENAGMPEDQKLEGLYYGYMTMAKALDLAGIKTLRRDGGPDVNWRQELARKLSQLQKADGSWKSDEERWMEAMPEIATPYSLLALAKCGG